MNRESTLDEVIVKSTPAAASAGSAAYRAVHACAQRLGISLQPLYPDVSDPELATWYVTHVDSARSKAVVEQLLGCNEIEGAYTKPRGEAPH
jgi:hypothetical protein